MNQDHIRELARTRAREILSNSASFRHLPMEEQKQMYKDLVQEQTQQLLGEESMPTELARRRRRGPQKASDLIDDSRHEKGFEEGVDAFEDLVDSVDFPQFVADLLKAVFDANMEVMEAQTNDYIRLMKAATTDLANFIKQVNNDDAKAYVAQQNPTDFNILVEEDGQGGEKIALTKADGEEVDEDEEKALVSDAKIRMAQEHRAALREIILMGVTRLVVEKGEVEAEVNFEFKGKRKADRADKAIMKEDQMSQTHGSYGGGFLGLFGGPRGQFTRTKRKTQFSVSSAKSTNEDELKAKLRGFVNIKFKTDYFKLDNFAQMYGPPSPEEQQAAQNPAAGLLQKG